MVFSSLVFLLIFFPISLFLYYFVNPKFRNSFLLIASVIFYIWGASVSFPILATSIVTNYIFALCIDCSKEKKRLCKMVMILMLFSNIGLLFVYKYLSFTFDLLSHIYFIKVKTPNWILPLGISFFTFSAISYVLDVYFGAEKAEKNILNVSLYILFFPKLISGPIVKWGDFNRQLSERKFSIEQTYDGASRFVIGLAKKVIIADTVAPLVDMVFNKPILATNSVFISWFAILAFLVQLYFDFSGYSDMAIGLGKLFGFELDENFCYPYASTRITEFWSKWHITLGTWIKHYVYTPVFRSLSKKKNKSTGKKISSRKCDYIALFVSWIIIGVWHGAGYKFVFYGMFYFAFILIERSYDSFTKRKRKADLGKKNIFFNHILPHIYFLAVIFIGQMIFRANSLKSAANYMLSMFGLRGNSVLNDIDLFYVRQYWLVLVIGIVFSLPIVPTIKKSLEKYDGAYRLATSIILSCLLAASIAFAVGNTYKAFIYFNF